MNDVLPKLCILVRKGFRKSRSGANEHFRLPTSASYSQRLQREIIPFGYRFPSEFFLAQEITPHAVPNEAYGKNGKFFKILQPCYIDTVMGCYGVTPISRPAM